MFGRKNKEIKSLKDKNNQLETKIRSLTYYKENEIDLSLEHFLGKKDELSNITQFKTLIYLQKIICNSILYHDFAYTALTRPHSAPRDFNLNSFLTRSSKNYRYIDIYDHPIYINGFENPIVTFPWNNRRIIDNLIHLGEDVNNKFCAENSNIVNVYIYPLGITLVNSGNHSQLSAILKNENKKIKINCILDISSALKKSDNKFTNFLGSNMIRNEILKDKWISLMKIGSYLNGSNFFPPKIMEYVEK